MRPTLKQLMFKNALLTLICLCPALLWGGDYEKAWEALNRNDRTEARALFTKALNDSQKSADAALCLILLERFDGNQDKGAMYREKYIDPLPNPSPYLFAFWWMDAFAGDYTTAKRPVEVKFLQSLLDNPKITPMLKVSARYHLGIHGMYIKQLKERTAQNQQIGSIMEWQYVGPFDNVSGSGFDKNYPPIAQPEPAAQFKSTYNADIRWFTPAKPEPEAWVAPVHFIRYNTAVVFAQTFITAPAATEALLNVGVTGNVRVWINDRLMLSEQEYLSTDFDVLKVKCNLEAGVNRVLVQLGYEDLSYPNFALRFTDLQGNLLTNLSVKPSYAPYKKDTRTDMPAAIPFAFETFFEEKLAAEPDNPLMYILLANTYNRSERAQKALETIEKILLKAPDNSLLRYERFICLKKVKNRTALTTEIQYFKDEDQTSLLSHILRFEEAMESEKYEEAEQVLNAREAAFGADAGVYEHRIKLYAQQEKIEPLVKLIEEGFRKYPDIALFSELRHNLAIILQKNPKEGARILSTYLDRFMNANLLQKLANEYVELGQADKGIKTMQVLTEVFPTEPSYFEWLYNYYYGVKDVKKAQATVDFLLNQSPFTGEYHKMAAQLAEQTGNTDAALAAFQKTLHYNPNDFDVRRRIRELSAQTDLTRLLPENDPYALLKKSKGPAKNGEFDWYYVLDERSTILYPERCTETYYTTVIKILNEKGIDLWKEHSIGYNGWRQRLIIEKAEVVKPNGSKFKAEENNNQLVFTNLEKGDGIYIKYRIVSYAYGRMAREFWDSYAFNAFVPAEISRYCLLAPKDIAFEHKTNNMSQTPETEVFGDFKRYIWETHDEAGLKQENMMPSLADIGKNIYISTIPNWGEIAQWYDDLSATQAKRDYEVQQAARKLFPAGQSFTELEKARRIYEFIVKNIRYSSVSFRQSAFVPQKASKVLQTRLGDCKDLSTLYAALAREAGLKANLVLVNTRDNGESSMPLPSIDFNHCIVKVRADGKDYYLELTDPNLPFNAIPNSDLGAKVLEIPFEKEGGSTQLMTLQPQNRLRDFSQMTTKITFKNRDLQAETMRVIGGAQTTYVRQRYSGLNREKQMEFSQKNIASRFNNLVTVKEVQFGDLEQLRDTLHIRANFTARNEMTEVGTLKTFKPPFFYSFFRSDAFPEETRTFPINYWRYEDQDGYEEKIIVTLQPGQAFTEVPTDVDLSFKGNTFQLHYEKKSPGELHVLRSINISRDNIPVKDYEAFRAFVDGVINAESRLVAFK